MSAGALTGRNARLLREYFEREGRSELHHDPMDAICSRLLAECLLTHA
jgi:hypothetical protein